MRVRVKTEECGLLCLTVVVVAAVASEWCELPSGVDAWCEMRCMCMPVCIYAASHCVIAGEFPEKADVLHQCAVRGSQVSLEAISTPSLLSHHRDENSCWLPGRSPPLVTTNNKQANIRPGKDEGIIAAHGDYLAMGISHPHPSLPPPPPPPTPTIANERHRYALLLLQQHSLARAFTRPLGEVRTCLHQYDARRRHRRTSSEHPHTHACMGKCVCSARSMGMKMMKMAMLGE
ncbi:unnamed protein product [Taenia asiatica]|uniref:Secreted protein n=1 Tax=Taenia asiatica TaxID=60517 RepID=A0A0R3W6L3_TAEAS|nr:unnamed protein product [Taenia asiatica]